MIKAAFFDLGGTISYELCLLLGPYYIGKKKEQDELEEKFKKKEISTSDFIIESVKNWKGVSINDIKGMVEKLTYIEKTDELLLLLRENNVKIVLIAKTPTPFLKEVCKSIGIDYVYGTDVEINNNIFTGEVIKMPISKGEAAEDFMKKNDLSKEECIAFGNDQSDLPMFEKVGLTVSYNGINGAENADIAVDDYEIAIEKLKGLLK